MSTFYSAGRMIAASKSDYINRYQDHVVVFNANVCTKSKGKIWYGDLDITRDEVKLKELAAWAKEDIYVLREADARFGNEEKPRLDRAVAIVTPGEIRLL